MNADPDSAAPRARAWNRARLVLALAVLAAAALFGLRREFGWTPADPNAAPLAPGRDAPKVLTVVHGGQDANLSGHYVPGGITIFAFYADWCAPCRAMEPLLIELTESHPAVFLRKIDIAEFGSSITKSYEIHSLPSVWVAGPEGAVELHHSSDYREIRSALRRLLRRHRG